MVNIEKKIRMDVPQVGVKPYSQVHAHSTGNKRSTAQNEADNQYNNRPEAFFTHVVGNGRIIQTANINRGAYDVGGDWNKETYAAVELIESHQTKAEFLRDYNLYVEFLRSLAIQGNIPITLDAPGVAGIKTHDYCRKYQPNSGTDHVDPYPYLAEWGISKEQFKKDIEAGVAVKPSQPKPTIRVNDIVKLKGTSAVTTSWSNDKKIDKKHVNQLYRVEQIAPLTKPKWDSTKQYLISSYSNDFRAWVYEQDLLLAASPKFKKGDKVMLRIQASTSGRYSSRSKISKKYLGKNYQIVDMAPTAEFTSPVQYRIRGNGLGDIWVIEQDLQKV